jgi:hypothetical protein
MQALSAAQVAEERVTALMTQLGLNAPALPRDEPSIRILLEDLDRPIEYAHLINKELIRYWGGVFFGIDETYLESIGLLLKSKEPWRPFCDFADRLTRMLHKEGAEALALSQELQLATKYLLLAKSHLSHIAYLLCRRMHGHKVADDAFGGKPSAVNELYALLLH